MMVGTERTILVAVQPPTEPADLEPVFELATATGWSIRLLTVSAPETAAIERDVEGDVDVAYTGSVDQSAEHGPLVELQAAFGARGIEAQVDVLPGPTVDVLLACAEAWNAGLVVLVGRSHLVDNRRILGSVLTTVLRAATRPVLVLPTAGPDPGAGYRAAVERLVDVIDRNDHDEDAAELREAAVEQLVAEPEAGPDRNPARRLRDALHRFETDHPTLTSAINDVSYYLSGMGI